MTNTFKTTIEIRRGDIVLVDFGDQIGSEQSGTRPAVVIQNNKGNEVSPTIIVCAITSQAKKKLPTHVEIYPNKTNGLEKNSIILAEQTRTVDKNRILKKCGFIDGNFLMDKINKALTISFGLLYNNVNMAKANY